MKPGGYVVWRYDTPEGWCLLLAVFGVSIDQDVGINSPKGVWKLLNRTPASGDRTFTGAISEQKTRRRSVCSTLGLGALSEYARNI